jgi:hypothetical protein
MVIAKNSKALCRIGKFKYLSLLCTYYLLVILLTILFFACAISKLEKVWQLFCFVLRVYWTGRGITPLHDGI